MKVSWKTVLSVLPAALIGLCLLFLYPGSEPREGTGDAEFEQVVLELSEAPGYFDTDNLISNETSYQQVVSRLQTLARPGQAYLGVGPDQNFTYIVHVQPALALIVDVRRDNLLQHLYFKELFERSENRWQYLSLLFGRPLALDPETQGGASVSTLVDAFRNLPAEEAYFESNLERIFSSLRRRFPRLIRADDRPGLEHIARPFYREHLNLRFRSHGRYPRPSYPTFEELLLEKDRSGRSQNYLNSRDSYARLRRLQREHKLVPVICDLAGPDALRRIGDFLRSRELTVGAFYTSNVEFYLFRGGRYGRFVENVRALPVDERSLFIRSYFSYGFPHPETVPGYHVSTLVQNMKRYLEEQDRLPYRSYRDVALRDFIPAP